MNTFNREVFFAETAELAKRYSEGAPFSPAQLLTLLHSITEKEAELAIKGISRIAEKLA
jgi:hypothetical protein